MSRAGQFATWLPVRVAGTVYCVGLTPVGPLTIEPTPNTVGLHNLLDGRRAALVIAHPGHELRVHGWLEMARPVVFVLTDGSGRTGRSRLASTRRILESANATPGSIFGTFTDARIYELMLRQDVSVLTGLVRELAASFIREDIDCVVGDALEGFNPSHDLCRFLINGTIALLRKDTGRALRNFDFPLDGPPESSATDGQEPQVRLELDAAALARKLDAARDYAALESEVASALSRYGSRAFATELLRPVDPLQGLTCMRDELPYYERVGMSRVRDGAYAEVIGYRTHVRPLVQELWRSVGLDVPDFNATDSPVSTHAR